MVPMPVRCERPNNREVSETPLTVPSNQDIVLDTPSISVRVRSIFHFAYRTNTAV